MDDEKILLENEKILLSKALEATIKRMLKLGYTMQEIEEIINSDDDCDSM